jgi:hypothetical protein
VILIEPLIQVIFVAARKPTRQIAFGYRHCRSIEGIVDEKPVVAHRRPYLLSAAALQACRRTLNQRTLSCFSNLFSATMRLNSASHRATTAKAALRSSGV